MAHPTELSPPPALASIAKPALFLDFDGTLVEIADEPDAIEVPASLPDLLARMRERFAGRVAIVTGRAREDLARHLSTIPVAMAGSHGAAVFDPAGAPIGDPAVAIPDTAKGELRAFAEREGLYFEDKPHGAGLHYRSRPERREAAEALADELAQRHDLTIKRGKQVIELVARGADKGTAVRHFLQLEPFAGATPIFLGDDVTDEDGFAACAGEGGFGILVGAERETAAQYRLGGVDEVRQWLTA